MSIETENVEFKERFTDEIYKEVVAFANTDGGVIFVGVDDQGKTVGLTDVDEECLQLTNGIRDAIEPDVTIFTRYTIRDDKVVKVDVSEGTNKPYFLKKKGMKPSGVYVRQGTSSAQASQEQIRRMIKENDGDVFEEYRSLEQELTFESAKRAFELNGVEFSPEKYRLLGITHKKDDLFTNLAKLLSDQCEHTIKIAVFSDDARTVFRDSKEFSGSIFKQFENAIDYLALCNKTSSVIKGVVRVDKRDYPEEAIREALLNAIVHRDYSYSGSIIVNATDRDIEFISLGGLLPGLAIDDIRAGVSQPRNKALAEIFHRLRLIESYGTGIRRIFKLYEGRREQPRIEITPNTFKIVLPNMNAEDALDPVVENALTPQMKLILQRVKQEGRIDEKEIAELLGVKKTRAYSVAKQLRDLGVVKVVGRGANKYYTL